MPKALTTKTISKIKDVWGFFGTDLNFRSYSPMSSNTCADYPDLKAETLLQWQQSLHSGNLAWAMGKLQSGHATYPSKVLPRMERCSLDFFQRYCELAKAAGMYVVAYTDGGDDAYAHRQHPEWFREYGQLFACLNSPFWDREFEAVREMLRLFPADGLFYDMVMFSGYCACEFCQAAYRKFYGEKMPDRHDPKVHRDDFSDERRDTLRFQLDTYRHWVRRATQAGREIVPGIEISLNQQWSQPDGLPYELLEHFDWYFCEFGHAEWVGEIMRAWGDKPIVCGAALDPRGCAHLLGRRIHPCGAEVYQDHRTGRLLSAEHRCLAPVRQSMDALKECEPYVMDAIAVPHAAVLHSGSGELYHRLHAGNYSNVIATTLNEAARMNLNCCTVERAEQLTTAVLKKYEVIFAPDMSCEDAKLTAMLRQWVAQGGVLVTSGLFGLISRQGTLLPDFADQELLGIKKMEGPCAVFSMLNDYRLGGAMQTTDCPIELGRAVVCAPTAAEPVAYGNVGADENVPLLWQNKIDRGVVFYLAGSVAAGGYHQRSAQSQNALRSCLQALLRPHIRKAPFKTSTECPTEIWLNEQPGDKRLVMHIVAFEQALVGQHVSVRADLIAGNRMEIVYPSAKQAVIHGERKEGYVRFSLPDLQGQTIAVLKKA
ncbi:MAG: hypothetical protein PHR35_05345 [Kiritimatiellae bacterium]|nr:hypothetical protein [Kiritimatiellia bacterium]